VIHAVYDKEGSPTYTRDFASSATLIVMLGLTGVYNMSGQGRARRYDVAKKIVEYMGTDTEVYACASAFFEGEYSAPRPESEILINKRLKLRDINPRPWEESLRDYIENDYR
jgi:dTDP-4-dehydrorhamnose reductase